MLMRRRVGSPLLRGAVVAGGAYAVGHHAATRSAQEQQQSADIAQMQAQQDQMAAQMQQQQMQEQQMQQQAQIQQQAEVMAQQMVAEQQAQQAAHPPAQPMAAPAPAQPDKIAQLKELGDLKTAGVLTEEEFQAEKAKILSS
jgi:TolA-binding protein